MSAYPCPLIPKVYSITPTRIVAEYLPDHIPLGKIGLTSTRHGIARLTGSPGKFKRFHLRPVLLDLHGHFDLLIDQLRQVASYLQQHGLWHEDVMPQNVMWRPADHSMRLVDIAAFVPRRLLDAGRPPYIRGRTRGVIRPDYSVDESFARLVFLQDLAPLPIILLRKIGLARAV